MNKLASLFLAATLALSPGLALAQEAVRAQPGAPMPTAEARADAAPAADAGNAAAATAADSAKVAAPPRMKPTEGIGMPKPGEWTLQEQFSPNGRYARWIHDSLLMPLITIISIFVLILLVWVVIRYRQGANAEPSKTSHNTFIEVVWTLVPVLILVGIAIPSIDLLARQYKPAPKDALTVKVTGYQWYWGYEYPDNGIAEFVSNMLPADKALANGEPALLAADNRLVLPVGKPIKLIITGADVIHSFAVPSLWVKEDAVPGRLNEKTFIIEKPGVYYGQCSELCGARHAFMPIAIEALPPAQFAQWVASQGGSMTKPAAEGAETSGAGAAAAPAEAGNAANAAAPSANASNAAANAAAPAAN